MAAFPTAFIDSALNKKGSIQPKNNHAITFGLATFILSNQLVIIKAEKSANAVSAADQIANHFHIAAVVFQTASSLSVICLTSFGNPDISAIHQALSTIGPYASTAN
jgi:uncharacterized membrane protein